MRLERATCLIPSFWFWFNESVDCTVALYANVGFNPKRRGSRLGTTTVQYSTHCSRRTGIREYCTVHVSRENKTSLYLQFMGHVPYLDSFKIVHLRRVGSIKERCNITLLLRSGKATSGLVLLFIPCFEFNVSHSELLPYLQSSGVVSRGQAMYSGNLQACATWIQKYTTVSAMTATETTCLIVRCRQFIVQWLGSKHHEGTRDQTCLNL